MGKLAELSSTARLSQPVTKSEQAPALYPLAKMSLISKETHGLCIRYYADKNRYYTLILAKRPRSDTVACAYWLVKTLAKHFIAD